MQITNTNRNVAIKKFKWFSPNEIKLNKEQLTDEELHFTSNPLFYIYLILCKKLIEYENETATTDRSNDP